MAIVVGVVAPVAAAAATAVQCLGLAQAQAGARAPSIRQRWSWQAVAPWHPRSCLRKHVDGALHQSLDMQHTQLQCGVVPALSAHHSQGVMLPTGAHMSTNSCTHVCCVRLLCHRSCPSACSALLPSLCTSSRCPLHCSSARTRDSSQCLTTDCNAIRGHIALLSI